MKPCLQVEDGLIEQITYLLEDAGGGDQAIGQQRLVSHTFPPP